MSPSETLRSVLLAFLTVLPAHGLGVQETPVAAPDAEPAAPSGVEVTFLANAGFHLRAGRFSILIDAFVREPSGPYGALPAEAYKPLVNAEAPYDGLTIALVSHSHPDHLQVRGLEKYLTNNPSAQLMASPDVVKAVKEGARELPAIQKQLTAVPIARGGGQRIDQGEMSIEFLELPHAGGKANQDTRNVAHLIEMGGVKMLHVGDADPTPDALRTYGFKGRGLDVAFVPYWFFSSDAAIEVLRDEIGAKAVVACHVPASERKKLEAILAARFPEVVMFTNALEKRSFFPAEAGAKR